MGNSCYRETKSLSIPNEVEQVSLPSPNEFEEVRLSSPPVLEEQSFELLPNGVTLLWLDSHVGKSNAEYEKMTLCLLRDLNGTSVRLYNDVSSCLGFIKSVQHDQNIGRSKIFLIVSGALSLQILPELKSFSIVESVIIFCMDHSKYIHLKIEYEPLIIGIYTENQELYNCLSKQFEELNHERLIFHFFAQGQNTTRNLTKNIASFLWFQLFQTIISDLKCTKNDMNVMLDYCSQQSKNTPDRDKVLSYIKQFRQHYQSKDAIRWYTKESFVYRLLNKALRTEDIEALYIFKYFLADLCRQLKLEHKKVYIQQSEPSILTLYRGGCMSYDEFNRLKESIGDLISLNGFISTSRIQWVAMEFLKQQDINESTMKKVLFIIEVDIQSEKIICADIGELSTEKQEAEFLFNMGTAFYLTRIENQSDQEFPKIYMKATEDGIKAANDYIKLLNQESKTTNVSIIFGRLFLQLGNSVMAQKYFRSLLDNSEDNDPDIPAIRYHLALTYGYPGKLHVAEELLNKVYNHYKSTRSEGRDLGRTKNALGWIFHSSGELNQAMDCYEEALDYAKNQLNLDHLTNAQTYSLIGDWYLEQHKLDEAKKCYEQALAKERMHLPIDHPRIGVTYNDLGNVYRKKEDMNRALEYYEKAESIFCRNLPSHHPDTAYCWSCMAFVYLYEGQIEQAQEYHNQALKTYRRVLPPEHLNIQISEKNATCTDIKKINDNYFKNFTII